jgi:capsid protein
MSLQTQIHSLVIRVAEEFKAVYSKIGSLASLSTTDKSTLVAAINELRTTITAFAVIDDLTPGSTTTTFSASKIVTLLDALRAQILGGADAAYDTLLELQQALQNDQTGIAALTAAIDTRVRFDAAQMLTAPEQLQARTNIGAVASTDVGNTATDFVAIFDAALIA